MEAFFPVHGSPQVGKGSENGMNILHFNTYLNGGAAIAARRLHEKLVRCNIASSFAHHPCAGSTGGATYRPLFSPAGRLRELAYKLMFKIPLKPSPYYYLSNRPKGCELFSFPVTQYKSSFDPRKLNADIINLNWIAEWIDYPSFFASIPDAFPIVWTLHDMNPFTGGCHYSWECEKFKTGCHSCFQLNEKRSPRDISFRFSKIKLAALRRKNIHVVADSVWLESQARASRVFENVKSFQTIHYGLDMEIFKPKDKNLCRQLLDIPESAMVICFGAANIDDRRKGFALLKEALERVSSSHAVYCLLFGAQGADLPLNAAGQKYVGSLSSVDLQTIVYSAADVFVIPSLYEAFGLTALEAMACGVPAVGFNTGGIPDMIQPHKNGLLAAHGDARDLAQEIMYMIDHPEERVTMGSNARKGVTEHFSDDVQAEKYMELFKNLI